MKENNVIGRISGDDVDDDDRTPKNGIEMEEMGRMLDDGPAFDKSETECGWWCFRGKIFQKLVEAPQSQRTHILRT